jgi:hypothetical protein
MNKEIYLAIELTRMQLKMQLHETIPALRLRTGLYRKLLKDVEEDLRDSKCQLHKLKTSS